MFTEYRIVIVKEISGLKIDAAQPFSTLIIFSLMQFHFRRYVRYTQGVIIVFFEIKSMMVGTYKAGLFS